MQEGDVKLFQTNDDGNIEIVNGITTMTPNFETMAYLCLFGGNEDDDGRSDNLKSWWGNINEEEKANHYRSGTQFILKSLPATSGNLLKVEDAAKRDLNVFLEQSIASSVDVFASIPALNWINILIKIQAEGEEHSFKFVENWKAAL